MEHQLVTAIASQLNVKDAHVHSLVHFIAHSQHVLLCVLWTANDFRSALSFPGSCARVNARLTIRRKRVFCVCVCVGGWGSLVLHSWLLVTTIAGQKAGQTSDKHNKSKHK